MARQFANGTFAWGLCDYCGARYRLHELRPTSIEGRKTGFLACPEDWSVDHPQNFLPQVVAAHGADTEALKEPRPDPNTDRDIFGNQDWIDLLTKGYGGV